MQTTMRMFAVPNANIFRRRKDFPLHFGKKASGLILLTATVYTQENRKNCRCDRKRLSRSVQGMRHTSTTLLPK